MATLPERVIAATLGWDGSEVSEYRYQSTRTSRAIYNIGSTMFCVGKRPPRDYENWAKHRDQFFAAAAGTTLWSRKTE